MENNIKKINYSQEELDKLGLEQKDNFWQFGNLIKKERTEIPSSSDKRKERMIELIEEGGNIANNSFEKFFLDYMSLENTLINLDIIEIYKDDYCFTAIENNKKIALYVLDSITRYNYGEKEDELFDLKEKIENESDIIIDKIYYLNVSRSKNVDIVTFL